MPLVELLPGVWSPFVSHSDDKGVTCIDRRFVRTDGDRRANLEQLLVDLDDAALEALPDVETRAAEPKTLGEVIHEAAARFDKRPIEHASVEARRELCESPLDWPHGGCQ